MADTIELPLIVRTDTYTPDAKKHLIVSLVKSVVRIAGYACIYGIPGQWAIIAATVLIVSEVIGIVEELV